jgi:hypothetical protein
MNCNDRAVELVPNTFFYLRDHLMNFRDWLVAVSRISVDTSNMACPASINSERMTVIIPAAPSTLNHRGDGEE